MAALSGQQRTAFAALHDAVVQRWIVDTSDEDEWMVEFTARVHADCFFGQAAPPHLEHWPRSMVRVTFTGVVGLATRPQDELTSGEAVWFLGIIESTEWERYQLTPRLRPKPWHGDRIHAMLSFSTRNGAGIEIMFREVAFALDADPGAVLTLD